MQVLIGIAPEVLAGCLFPSFAPAAKPNSKTLINAVLTSAERFFEEGRKALRHRVFDTVRKPENR